MRSLTAPAAVSWAAYLGWLNLHSSPLAFMGSTVAVAILSLLAIGELIADKMPKTPSRTSLMPLLARILMGGLCGASLCASANQSLLIGALLGGMGSDRSIRRLRDPETLGEQTKRKRHFHRHTRRLDRNRPGLLSCNSRLKRRRNWTAFAPIRARAPDRTTAIIDLLTSTSVPRCWMLDTGWALVAHNSSFESLKS